MSQICDYESIRGQSLLLVTDQNFEFVGFILYFYFKTYLFILSIIIFFLLALFSMICRCSFEALNGIFQAGMDKLLV